MIGCRDALRPDCGLPGRLYGQSVTKLHNILQLNGLNLFLLIRRAIRRRGRILTSLTLRPQLSSIKAEFIEQLLLFLP
jgi:hypothetical protein